MAEKTYFEKHAARRETLTHTVLVHFNDDEDKVRIEVRPKKSRGAYRMDIPYEVADALRYALMDEID